MLFNKLLELVQDGKLDISDLIVLHVMWSILFVVVTIGTILKEDGTFELILNQLGPVGIGVIVILAAVWVYWLVRFVQIYSMKDDKRV